MSSENKSDGSNVLSVVLLYTSTPNNLQLEKKQDRLLSVLESKQMEVKKIDGSNSDHKDLRGVLWAISGKRAVYPQAFIEEGPDSYKFVGDYTSLIDECLEEGTFDEQFPGCFNV